MSETKTTDVAGSTAQEITPATETATGNAAPKVIPAPGAITPAPTAAMVTGADPSVPAWIPQGERTGAEGITEKDARVPRLSIAQGLSHQMLRGDPLYIDGLKLGEAFNDLSEQIYGDGPLDIVVVRADRPRYVEFADDRSVIDPDVPAGDPRTEFTTDEKTGERVPPLATKFYDYIILAGKEMEPMAFSCARSAIKHTAMKLNGLLRIKPVPIFACRYRLRPTMMKNDQGSWFVFSVQQAGFLDEASYKRAEAAFNFFKEKTVEFDRVNRQPGDGDPDEM